MSAYEFGTSYPPEETKGNEHVDVEVNDGVTWFSLNDHYNYIVGAGSMENSAQPRRTHTVSSPQYDGEFVVHSTLGNVTESMEVYVLGADQIIVSDNIQRLVQAFSQDMYQVRVTLGNDVTYWRCWPAEYAISRGHVNIHNRRASVKLEVSRFPKTTREVLS